jgi:spore germination cell wall hydrolase CwlJ-like protein
MLALLPTMAGFMSHPNAVSGASGHGRAPAVSVPLPPPTDMQVEPISAEDAEAANAAQPISTEPIVAARPFVIPLTGEYMTARLKAVQCLTEAVYYEAASENILGQRAVAQVVLNRVRHPAFPKSVCGVVYQGSERSTGCQFTFTCDGSMARIPNRALWNQARLIADAALSGSVEASVGTATHYHTRWVRPYWAPSLNKLSVIGAHIFYRWKGFWGQNPAFNGSYSLQQELATRVPGMPEQPEMADGLTMPADAWTNMATPPPGALPSLSPLSPTAAPLTADTIVPLNQSRAAGVAADAQHSSLIVDERRGQLVVDGH